MATLLLNNGTDIRFIQELVGHNSSKTTERYTRIPNRKLEPFKRPIDRIIKKNADNQHIKNKLIKNDITKLSEPSSDIH